jgi:hypothetical protein
MLDIVLKLIALTGFVASLSVLVIWVPSPDLIAVVVVVAAMAVYDLLVRPVLRRRGRGV